MNSWVREQANVLVQSEQGDKHKNNKTQEDLIDS